MAHVEVKVGVRSAPPSGPGMGGIKGSAVHHSMSGGWQKAGLKQKREKKRKGAGGGRKRKRPQHLENRLDLCRLSSTQ